ARARALGRLPEAIEDTVEILRRDSAATVLDRDDELGIADDARPHTNASAARRELDGVRDQVEQHLRDPLRIHGQRREVSLEILEERDACRDGQRGRIADRGADY